MTEGIPKKCWKQREDFIHVSSSFTFPPKELLVSWEGGREHRSLQVSGVCAETGEWVWQGWLSPSDSGLNRDSDLEAELLMGKGQRGQTAGMDEGSQACLGTSGRQVDWSRGRK